MKTKEIDITEIYGSPAKVLIKKFTAGDLAEIRDSINVSMIGGTESANPQMGQLFLLTLVKGIYNAPFIKVEGNPTIEEIREIDGELADFISREINTFNNISPN